VPKIFECKLSIFPKQAKLIINKENNLGFLINVITNLHVLTVAIKAVGRVGKMIINSNLGTIALNHMLSFFGLG
jgi:hypothetical protein